MLSRPYKGQDFHKSEMMECSQACKSDGEELRILQDHGGPFGMRVRGDHYRVQTQVYSSVVGGFRHINVLASRGDAPCLYCPVFTTMFGGLFGYVIPMDTGERVVVVWRSAREFCALRAIIKARTMLSPRVVKSITVLSVGGMALQVVYVARSQLSLLLSPSLTVSLPAPMMSHSCDCVIVGVEDGPLSVTMLFKILLDGDLVLHGVIFRPQFDPLVCVPDGGVTPFFRRYSPRGVQSVGTLPPESRMDWGVEEDLVSDLR